MSQVTLVYLHPHFTIPGGAGNVVLECASRLDPERYDIHILCIRVGPKYRKKYPALRFIEIGGPLSSSPLFWVMFPYVQYKVHRELNHFDSKVILPQVLPSNWWAFIYKIFHKRVLCLWYCNEPSAFIHIPQWIEAIHNPLMRMGAKLLNPFLKAIDMLLVSNGPDYVLGNSKFSNTLFEKAYHNYTTDHVYPGVDLTRFTPNEKKQDYFFMVSRLTRFKNVHVAIEAMAKIKHEDCQLIIGGEGEEKNKLIALTKKLGLSNRVRFVGRVPYEDLPKLYAEAKLVLFTSQDEPFGMVPVEALASGTPVVGSNSGGLRETVQHDYNGVLLNDLNPQKLANAIDDLLADPRRYKRLQENARISAEKFDWKQHVEKFEAILDDALRSQSHKLSPIVA